MLGHPSPLRASAYKVLEKPISTPPIHTKFEEKTAHKATTPTTLTSSSTLPAPKSGLRRQTNATRRQLIDGMDTTSESRPPNDAVGSLTRFLTPKPTVAKIVNRSQYAYSGKIKPSTETRTDHLSTTSKISTASSAASASASTPNFQSTLDSILKRRELLEYSTRNPRVAAQRSAASSRRRVAMKRGPSRRAMKREANEMKTEKKDRLVGILGNRLHHIFGETEADVTRLEDIQKTETFPSFKLDQDSFTSSIDLFETRAMVAQQNLEFTHTKNELTNLLLEQHHVYMEGRRATFIETQPCLKENPERAPKFTLPFSPVKNSAWDIKSEGSIVYMESEKFDDDDSDPDDMPPSSLRKPRKSQIDRRKRKTMGRLGKLSPKTVETRQLEKRVTKLEHGTKAHEDHHRSDKHHSVVGHIHVNHHDNAKLLFTRRQREAYFGPHARADFFHRFKSIHKQTLTIPNRDFLATIGRSPRSEFLAELEGAGELPWPVLSRSLHAPQVIDLSGMGLGDKVICALTRVLE